MATPQIPGFEILETMPVGGMSTVYRARQISLDRIVALKTLPPHLATAAEDVEKFLFEAKITANLKHPNIIQVYDFGQSPEGIYYFVMEYVSGYSVGEWIHRKGRLSEENALLIAQSVAEALRYAWEKAGVIHCDIKPDNVIIDSDGTVKVADLGLARSVRFMVDKTKTETGLIFGTPNYISPEQSRGDADLDCRTDIYALGAMLYHCVTGKMPFESLPPFETMDRQITDQIPDPQDVQPRLSTECACLLEKMMAKNPAQRQSDWHAVAKDVIRVINGQMPLGELPPPGASTVQRSALRGTRPRLKPAASESVLMGAEAQVDSNAFRQMERRFRQKQQSRLISRPEWWAAGIILAAVLALGVLVLKTLIFPSFRAEPAAKVSGSSLRPPATPAPAVVSSPPVAAAPVVDRAQEMFDFAVKEAAAHPDHYAEAIARFEKVAADTKGTKYHLMALDEIQKLREARQRAIDSAWKQLWQKADALAAQQQWDRAADLLDNYQGPWAGEIAALRKEKSRAWRQQAQAHQEKQRQLAAEADRQFQSLLNDVATALADGAPDNAVSRIQTVAEPLASSAHKREVEEQKAVLMEAARGDQRILASFRAQKDQKVDILLVKGHENVVVRNVLEDRVEVEEVRIFDFGQASVTKTLRVNDLALSERLTRLGDDSRPEVALAKGLLTLRAGDLKTTESYFSRAGPRLGPLLTARLNDRKNRQVEEQAQQALGRLLRSAGLEAADKLPGCEACLAAIQKKEYSPKDMQILARSVEAFQRVYGQAECARIYQPVLAFLANPSAGVPVYLARAASSNPPVGAPAGLAGPMNSADAVKARLIERNPGLSPTHLTVQTDYNGKIVRAEIIFPDLKDIQPLAACAEIRELVCAAVRPFEWYQQSPPPAPLEDLSPLQGLRLMVLVLNYTQVRDLAPLAGMPLERLYLAHTRVQDLAPLKGMRLDELDLGRTGVKNLGPLKGMPLRSLNLSDTQVDDLSALEGMPLQRLRLRGTPLKDLQVLQGMPLRDLDLTGTRVKDLEPLRNMPLRSLALHGTEVRNLAPLEGLPLKWLGLRDTPVKNIKPIQNLPIETIDLDFNPGNPRSENTQLFAPILSAMPALKKVNGQPVEAIKRGMRRE